MRPGCWPYPAQELTIPHYLLFAKLDRKMEDLQRGRRSRTFVNPGFDRVLASVLAQRRRKG